MLIVVKDAGSGFDPNLLPNPVMGENLLSSHGRGIYLINRLMDDVRFSFEQGTTIYMRRSPAARTQQGEIAHLDGSVAREGPHSKGGK